MKIGLSDWHEVAEFPVSIVMILQKLVKKSFKKRFNIFGKFTFLNRDSQSGTFTLNRGFTEHISITIDTQEAMENFVFPDNL